MIKEFETKNMDGFKTEDVMDNTDIYIEIEKTYQFVCINQFIYLSFENILQLDEEINKYAKKK